MVSIVGVAACSGSEQATPAAASGSGGAGLAGAGGGVGFGGGTGTADVEVCGNGLDDDGDGQADEDCPCRPGAMQACYLGPADKAGKGICAFGSQLCSLAGGSEVATGTWGPCEGSVPPQQEQCGDDLDSDCDGAADCDECASTGRCSGGDDSSGATSTGSGDMNTGSTGTGDMNGCNISGTFTGPGPDTGVPCMAGEVEYHTSAPAGCLPDMNILFCEAGTFHCVYGSCCEPVACHACLQAQCQTMSADPGCNAAIQDGFEWLAGCGPDRSAYYLGLQAQCFGGELAELNLCKTLHCLPDCSPW